MSAMSCTILTYNATNWNNTDMGVETDIKDVSNNNVRVLNKICLYDSANHIMQGVVQHGVSVALQNMEPLVTVNIGFSSDVNEPQSSDYVLSNEIQNLSISNLVITQTPDSSSIRHLLTFTVTNAGGDVVTLNKFGVTRRLQSAAHGSDIYDDNAFQNYTVLIAEGFLTEPIELAVGASKSIYIELVESNEQ